MAGDDSTHPHSRPFDRSERVMPELRGGHRCVVPTLPLGGHRPPMRADADLSHAASRHWKPRSWRPWICAR
jgi:hypothetical protein